MKIPSFVWIILLLIVGFGFLAFLSNNKNNENLATATLPVQIDVYVDFNCPHCAEFEPVAKAAREKYGDKVNIQLKNMPFLTSGQNPDTSVEYSYAYLAAKKQDKGNDYAQELFKWVSYIRQPSNTIYSYSDEEKTLFAGPVDVEKLATYLKLDLTQFNKDRASDEVKAEMKTEKEDAIKIMGAPSTPAIFFYGKLFKLNTYDDFDAKIDSYITAAQKNAAK